MGLLVKDVGGFLTQAKYPAVMKLWPGGSHPSKAHAAVDKAVGGGKGAEDSVRSLTVSKSRWIRSRLIFIVSPAKRPSPRFGKLSATSFVLLPLSKDKGHISCHELFRC